MPAALRQVSRLPLLLLAIVILATASAPLGAHAHGYKRHKKGGGGGGPSCSAIDRKCDFLRPENLTWQKQVAVFTLTSDGTTVECTPQNQDGLSSCEYINEMDELRLQVSCPGDNEYAVFQIATGMLTDIDPDGSATFQPFIPGITQSGLDGTAYATIGGAYGPNPDEELYWSMEIWCQPEFYPDGYPASAGAKVAGAKVRRTAVAGVKSATPAARVSKIRSAKVAEASG